MKNTYNYLKIFRPFDLVIFCFFTFLLLLTLIFHNRLEVGIIIPSIMGVVLVFIAFGLLDFKTGKKSIRVIHYVLVAPLILITFKIIYLMVYPIRQIDYDDILIKIDHFLFGVHPTQWLHQFSFPLVTEILQIVYGTFYFLPIILIVSYLITKEDEKSDYLVFAVVYGFYLSYIGYFLVPGVGPRFTLHNFEMTNTELPGLWLTEFLREMTNRGESIPSGTIDPIKVVQRDIFPSGHTMITAIVMYYSAKYNSKLRYFLIPVGTLLIFSTVYLRYHYVIDVIGGLIFMIISIWSGEKIYRAVQKWRGIEVSDKI